MTLTRILLIGITAGTFLCTNLYAYSVRYSETVTSRSGREDAKVFIKDRFFRIEGKSEGKATIIISNDAGLFAYVPAENTVLKLSAPGSSMGLLRHMHDFMGYLKQNNGTYIGTEEVGGIPCELYEYTDATTKKKTRAWIWKEHQFPLRMEVGSNTDSTVIENRDVRFDAPLDNALFSLPAGVPLYDFSTSSDVAQVIKGIQ